MMAEMVIQGEGRRQTGMKSCAGSALGLKVLMSITYRGPTARTIRAVSIAEGDISSGIAPREQRMRAVGITAPINGTVMVVNNGNGAPRDGKVPGEDVLIAGGTTTRVIALWEEVLSSNHLL